MHVRRLRALHRLGRLLALVSTALLALLALPGPALAHDDPIVTVRVLCNGFNVLDMDAVLGEISNSAVLSVDRPVQGGSGQIEAWVKEQMDKDLRIEIVDIGTPQRLTDGYTLSWTARFSRQDWREAGTAARNVSNDITIHNGRITQWNATFSASRPPGVSAAAASTVIPPSMGYGTAPSSSATAPGLANDAGRIASDVGAASSEPPALLGIPVTLLLALGVALFAAAWTVRRLVR